MISILCDFPSYPSCHPCTPHACNYPHASPLPIPRANSRNPHIDLSLPCRFSSIIPSMISSSFYASSLPWFYFQNHEVKPRNIWENIHCPIDPNPLKIRSNFHSKSSFEFNEVNWIQIYWTKYSFEIQILALDFKNVLGLKSFIWIRILQSNSKFPIWEKVETFPKLGIHWSLNLLI
jgi:hypothetical protein